MGASGTEMVSRDVCTQGIVLTGSTLMEELRSSSKRIGQLYPILIDYYGSIIGGKHRFNVDKKWKRIRLENIKTE